MWSSGTPVGLPACSSESICRNLGNWWPFFSNVRLFPGPVRRHSRCEALRFFSSQVGKGGGPVNSSQCPLPQSFIRPTRAACDIFPAKTNPMATLATLHSHDDVLSRRKIVQSTSIARRAGFSSQGSSKNESGITRMSEVDSIASAEGKDTDQSKQKELAQLEEHLWDVQQSDGLRSLTVLELRHVMRQINRPTAGRKEDLIREVELWVATRHRATIEQQGATRREVASDEESLEEALLKGESQSRQEASSRMTRAPRKGASKRELPQGKDEASPARKSSRIAAQRKETSEDGATGKFERQNKRRKNVEPQDEELEVALPKTRTSTTKSKLEEQVTGNKKNVTTVDDVKAKTPGRGQKAASSKAAGKVDEKKSDESKDIRKKGKIIPVDDEILVPKSDTVKSKNKRKSVTIVEDIVEPKTKVVKGKQSKVKKVAVEEDSEVLNADDGVKRKHKKQTKVKTIVVEENSAASKEPWTMLVHKKLQEGWVAYNPATMRPAPPENGARVTKLMSWNVNGLRALVKSKSALIQEAQLLATLATEEEFDVLCLQETKLQEKDVDQLSQILLSDYDSKFWSCSTSKLGYSGTAVFSKVKPIAVHYGMEFADHDPEGRLITLEFEKFFLLTSYVPNAGEKLVRLTYRTQEWDPALGQYIKTLEKQKPVVLTGDLNCCNEEIDICNPDGNRKSAGFTNEERSSFKANFLNQDLVDTFRHQHPNAVGYTYWGYRTAARPKNQGWRLDYFLVSKSLLEHVHDSYTRPDVLGSDHCPIGLILNLPSA